MSYYEPSVFLFVVPLHREKERPPPCLPQCVSLQSNQAHGDVRQGEPKDRVQCVTSQLRYTDYR